MSCPPKQHTLLSPLASRHHRTIASTRAVFHSLAAASGGLRRRAQSAAVEKVSSPRRRLQQNAADYGIPLAGLSVQVLYSPPLAPYYLCSCCANRAPSLQSTTVCVCTPATPAAASKQRSLPWASTEVVTDSCSEAAGPTARPLQFGCQLHRTSAHDRRWTEHYNHYASCILQVFKPYTSPYTLPIPASVRPSATTTAPSVNYTQASSGGVMALANATTDFALRFTGEFLPGEFEPSVKADAAQLPRPPCPGIPLHAGSIVNAWCYATSLLRPIRPAAMVC